MAPFHPRKPEKFRLPYTTFLEDLSPYLNNKTTVISFFGVSGMNFRGCKVTLIDSILGYQVFRKTIIDEPEFDPDVMCSIEGCYDHKRNVLYLHLIGMYDDYLVTKVLKMCKEQIAEEGYFYVWSHLKSRFTRALLFLFHISHIMVFNHTGPVLETTFSDVFQTLNMIRMEMLPRVQETLSQIPGVSQFWASSGRFCIPRVLWFFQTCPPVHHAKNLDVESQRRIERDLEIQVLDVFGQARFSDGSKNSLFLLPRDMEFVFMVFDETDQITDPNFILNSMIDSLRNPDSIQMLDQLIEYGMERHRPAIPTVEERYEGFLQTHIGHIDGSSREANQRFASETPTLRVVLEVANALYGLMVLDHPRAAGPMSYLTGLMNLDERFSDQTCILAMPLAMEVYMKDLPVWYSENDHVKRMELAVQVFQNHAKGPLVDDYLSCLLAEIEQYWNRVRERCKEQHQFMEPRVEMGEAAAVMTTASADLWMATASLQGEESEYQWMDEAGAVGPDPDSFSCRVRGHVGPSSFNIRDVDHEFPPLHTWDGANQRDRRPVSVPQEWRRPTTPPLSPIQNIVAQLQRLQMETASRAEAFKPIKNTSSKQGKSEQYQGLQEPAQLQLQGLPRPTQQQHQGLLGRTQQHQVLPGPTQQRHQGLPGPIQQWHQGLPGPTQQRHQGLPRPTQQQYQGLPGPTQQRHQVLPGPTQLQFQGLPGPKQQRHQGLPGPTQQQHPGLPGPAQLQFQSQPGRTQQQNQGQPGPTQQQHPGLPGPAQLQFQSQPGRTQQQHQGLPMPAQQVHPEEREYYERLGAIPRNPASRRQRSLRLDLPSLSPASNFGPLIPPRDFPSILSPRDFFSLPSVRKPSHPPVHEHSQFPKFDFGPNPPTVDVTPSLPTKHDIPSRPPAREPSHPSAHEASHPVAREASHPVAREASHPAAREASHPAAHEASHPVAREASHPVAREASHPVAREASHPVAREASHPVAREASHPVAREASHPVAREASHSHPVAREASHHVAREASHPVAREASHPVACEASHPVAREASHPVAREASHSHPVAREASHPVAREASRPTREPSHPSARERSHFPKREPTNPPKRDFPSHPSAREPSHPSARKPSHPSARERSHFPKREPTNPPKRDFPSHPSAREPSHPSARKPSHPSARERSHFPKREPTNPPKRDFPSHPSARELSHPSARERSYFPKREPTNPPKRDFPSHPSAHERSHLPKREPTNPPKRDLPSKTKRDFGPLLPMPYDFPPLPPVRPMRPPASDPAIPGRSSISKGAASDSTLLGSIMSRNQKKDMKQYFKDKMEELRASSLDLSERPNSPVEGAGGESGSRPLGAVPRNNATREQTLGSGDHRKRVADAVPYPTAFGRATNLQQDVIAAAQNRRARYRQQETQDEGIRYKPPKYSERRQKTQNK